MRNARITAQVQQEQTPGWTCTRPNSRSNEPPDDMLKNINTVQVRGVFEETTVGNEVRQPWECVQGVRQRITEIGANYGRKSGRA